MLWLWCRPAAAALIHPLAQELPYATGAALKKKKKKKRKKERKKKTNLDVVGERMKERRTGRRQLQ